MYIIDLYMLIESRIERRAQMQSLSKAPPPMAFRPQSGISKLNVTGLKLTYIIELYMLIGSRIDGRAQMQSPSKAPPPLAFRSCSGLFF